VIGSVSSPSTLPRGWGDWGTGRMGVGVAQNPTFLSCPGVFGGHFLS